MLESNEWLNEHTWRVTEWIILQARWLFWPALGTAACWAG